MRKVILTVFLCLFSIKTFAISASSAILIDGDSGRILMEQNAFERRGMASTTKIMTAVVAIEHGNLDDIVTVSHSAANVEGSSMWLKEGEKLPLKSLLYGLMLNSGNDAATAIAEHIGGSIEDFAVMMNKTAQKIGVKDTHFTNPHGLDNDEHYTTAYDLAQITRYALNNKTFSEIVSTKSKLVQSVEGGFNRNLNNHNKMLSLYDNADGVKTGFTKKCGRCLVSSATRNNVRLIAVTLNAPDDWNDHTEMLDYGFSNYSPKTVLKKNDYIKSVLVKNGTDTKVSLITDSDLKTVLQNNDCYELQYEISEVLDAPIIIGKIYGKVNLLVNGKIVSSCNAVAKYGVLEEKKSMFINNLSVLMKNLMSNFS